MKAVIHVNAMAHQREHAALMAHGLRRHGVEVAYGGWDRPEPCDFAVVWGARQPNVLAQEHVLIMERGHLPDRMAMTSCGWDGLGRRGRYPGATDGGERWRRRYAHLMQPWREDNSGYALILGQVEGDAALQGLDGARWVEDAARELARLGWAVRFRPHPLTGRGPAPTATTLTTGTLAEGLAGAAMAVTFNSTAGVEAVLAGVPTIVMDAGGMAYPVAAHALHEAPLRPDRESWAFDLAWTQWTLEEIAAGDAWAHLQPIMEAA